MTGPRRPGSSRPVPAAWAVHLAMLAVVATAFLGTRAAVEPASAALAATQASIAAAVYLVVWAMARHVGDGDELQIALAVGGAAAGAYFLVQYQYLALDAKVPALDALARGLSRPFRQYEWWAPVPNSLATLLDGVVGASLGLVLGRGRIAGRAVAAMALGVVLLAVVASASRGSWLAVGGAVAAGFWVARRLPLPPLAAGVALLVAAAAAVTAGAVGASPPWWVRAAAAAGRPDRLEVFQHAATLLRDMPFTGIGAGDQFAYHLSKYALLIQVPFLTYSHNLVFEQWLEYGLAGLAAWIALAVATVVVAAAGERAGAGWRFRGVWVGLLAVHLHGVSDARQSVDAWTWLPFVVLTALLAARAGRHGLRLGWAGAAAPLGAALVVGLAIVAARGSVGAAWQANQGAVAQARADLGEGADAETWSAEAERRFQAAVAADPNDIPARRRYGLLALDRGRFELAREHLRYAERLDQATRSTRKGAGLAALWSGDLDEAVRLLRGLPAITDELNAWSQWRRSRDEVDLARHAARVSLALDPAQPAVAQWLAQLDAAAPQR